MPCMSLKIAAVSAALFMVPAGSAFAAGECGTRDVMVETLAKKFEENPVALGVVNSGAVLEIFVSDSGTWTILATSADGRSCVLSVGVGWDSATVLAAWSGH